LENGNFALQASFPNTEGDGWGVVAVLASMVTPQGTRPLGDFVSGTVLPVVRAWADDAGLFTRYNYLPNRFGPPSSHDPNATASEAAIIQNAGWPLAYVSAAKHEALFFYQGGQVLSVQWARQRYAEATVPVTKAAAIATVVAALRDPNAMSKEARTGRDYYLGVPYAGVFSPNPVNFDDTLVPTTDVPDGIDWNGFLGQEFVDKPTWYIGSTWGGGGQVDALTGTLIRFTRLRVGHGTGGPPSPVAGLPIP
jgi:hypothetical protein